MRKLEAELRRYANSDMYPFHMPGHKQRGDEIHQIDITEIDGFDNLHDPEGLILEEMQRAAEFYDTETTFFSVNGSTCALMSAISAAVPKGGTLLCERGCHISVYHTAYLRDLQLLYLEDMIENREDGHLCLKTETDIDAVIITSPTYEGIVKPVQRWAEFAHQRQIPLIVDEAHGAHFSMHAYFPQSAVREGADLVVQSLHKTLPAMTQTALLHNVTGKVSSGMIKRFLDIYETSSPSYVLMASITSCLHQVMDENQDLFERYTGSLKRVRRELSGMKHLRLLGGEMSEIHSAHEFPPYRPGCRIDPGKICILTSGTSISGPDLYRILRTEYQIQPEMKAPEYVILMTSPYDTQEGFQRLISALLEIDANISMKCVEMNDALQHISPKICMRISEAMDRHSEWVTPEEAVNHIAADYVIVYPPDSPLIVPGEQYSEEVIKRLGYLQKIGVTLTGITDGKVQVLPFDAG